MIVCSNCGAKFQENVPKCPYCGQIYIPGAEKEYMDDLREIKGELSEIESISEEIYQNEIKKNAKKTGVIVAVLVALLLTGIFLGVGMNHLFSYEESEEEIKARIMWERENFPTLDAWYDNGEYQAILDFMEETYEEKGYSVYEWEHYHFVAKFENYQTCMNIKKRLAAGEEISKFDAGELLYCGMSLINYENENAGYVMETYSESEIETLEKWKQEVEDIFFEELQYSQEEFKKLENKLYEDGFLSYNACCDYRKGVLERIQGN